MRIGVIRDRTIVNSLYRAVIPLGALAERKKHEVVWETSTPQGLNLSILSSCDVVYIHRMFDDHIQKTVRQLSAQGVALWWDNDDDITAVEKNDPMYREIGGARGAKIFAGMSRMMMLADVVSTPSTILAERYRNHGAEDVRVLENYVADEFTDVRASRRNGEVVVGWVAAQEHRADADRLRLRETLQALLDTHPDVEIASIGVNLGLKQRYRHTPKLSLKDLAPAIAGFDVGIAPIVNSRLNQARSNVKLKEYASVGVPWLASPIGPYAGLGEKQGGRLVDDTAWLEQLSALVTDQRLRGKLGKRAAKWGQQQTIGRNVTAWETVLQAAVTNAARRVPT
jgi:hypothetical protein